MDSDLEHRLKHILEHVPDLGWSAAEWAEDEVLFSRARDRALPANDRLEAARRLVERHRTDLTASPLVDELLDDADEAVALVALELVLPFDARLLDRLRGHLRDPRPRFKHAAALALGRRKDRATMPVLLEWLRVGSIADRRAAVCALCWILNPPERHYFLGSVWEAATWLEPDDRIEVALQLFALGDTRGLVLLRAEVERAGSRASEIRAVLQNLDAPPP